VNECNTAILQRAAPTLFRDLHGDEQLTCMAWGFECSDGWYPLLLKGVVRIEQLIQTMSAVGIPDDELPVAAQVKSKFGTLCFYMDRATPEIRQIVREMEQQSRDTCEVCGGVGTPRGIRDRFGESGGWVSTMCDTCQEKIMDRPRNE